MHLHFKIISNCHESTIRFLHSTSTTHLALKPSKIFLDSSMNAYVADAFFGQMRRSLNLISDYPWIAPGIGIISFPTTFFP